MHLMGATRWDSGRAESTSHSAKMWWWAVMAQLVMVTAASWVTAVWLSKLPTTDDSDRSILYYCWHHTSGWWSGVFLAAAGVLSLILATVLLVQIVRHVPGRWRILTMVVGGGAWLCGTAYLAALVFVGVLLAGSQGTQTIAKGSDGAMVMIIEDTYYVDVCRPATSVTYVREPGAASVDPRSGPCRLDRETESQMRLTCGSTSQLMSADLRRP